MRVEANRVLRCEHCHTWYTVSRVVPQVCPHCEKPALWKSAEALTPKPFRLTKDDQTFLRVNRIASWENDDDDDGA